MSFPSGTQQSQFGKWDRTNPQTRWLFPHVGFACSSRLWNKANGSLKCCVMGQLFGDCIFVNKNFSAFMCCFIVDFWESVTRLSLSLDCYIIIFSEMKTIPENLIVLIRLCLYSTSVLLMHSFFQTIILKLWLTDPCHQDLLLLEQSNTIEILTYHQLPITPKCIFTPQNKQFLIVLTTSIVLQNNPFYHLNYFQNTRYNI